MYIFKQIKFTELPATEIEKNIFGGGGDLLIESGLYSKYSTITFLPTYFSLNLLLILPPQGVKMTDITYCFWSLTFKEAHKVVPVRGLSIKHP